MFTQDKYLLYWFIYFDNCLYSMTIIITLLSLILKTINLDTIHCGTKLCYRSAANIKILFPKTKNQSICIIFWRDFSCSIWMAYCWNVIRNLWIYTVIQVIYYTNSLKLYLIFSVFFQWFLSSSNKFYAKSSFIGYCTQFTWNKWRK